MEETVQKTVGLLELLSQRLVSLEANLTHESAQTMACGYQVLAWQIEKELIDSFRAVTEEWQAARQLAAS